MARNFITANSDYLSRSAATVNAYPFTFACWSALRAVGNVFSLGNTLDASSNYVRAYAGSDALSFTVGNLFEGFVNYSSPAPGILSGAWRHLAVTAASTTARTTYYDGGQIGSSAAFATWPTGLNVTALGCLHRASRSVFADGALAHAAFWSVALSAGEIAALASGASPLLIRPASLIEYWPLRGLACDTPEPGVTRARDLTVVGTSWAASPPNVWSPTLGVHDGLPWYALAAGIVVTPDSAGGFPVCLDPVSRAALGFSGLGIRAIG